jgi:hypothetical protein
MLAATTMVAMLALAAPSFARPGGDRNHDRIPDRWERAHHLSLRVDQARRDQDHDGLRNRAEFLAGTDPRDADTDGDGTHDGAEGAGRVVSFAGGVLTVHLFGGDDVHGAVDASTHIVCTGPPATATTVAQAASDGSDGSDDGPGDRSGRGDDGSGDAADDAADDEHGQPGCDASALSADGVIREAQLQATAAGLRFEHVVVAR